MLAMIYADASDTDDREFMDWLYHEYERLMFATARKYLSIPEDVEDVVHTSLLRMMKKISDLRKFECCILTAYVVSTVRNTSINFLRDKRRQEDRTASLEDAIPSGALPIDELMELAERREQLSKVWGQLSEADQILLEGKYISGCTDAELAERLRCKPGSVRMKLTRAKRRVLALLTREGKGAEI